MISDVAHIQRNVARNLVLQAERPTNDIRVLQIWIRRLNRAQPIGATLQYAGIRRTWIDIASVHRWVLVPIQLTWCRCRPSSRCRQRKSRRSNISNSWIGGYTGGASWPGCIHITSTEQKSTWVRAEPHGRIVLVLL